MTSSVLGSKSSSCHPSCSTIPTDSRNRYIMERRSPNIAVRWWSADGGMQRDARDKHAVAVVITIPQEEAGMRLDDLMKVVEYLPGS